MKQQQLKIELLSVKQVANMLNVSSKTVRRMIVRCELNHHRVGRVVRISSEDLRAYTNSIRQ
jgi:excisionase family DNA binding protein